GVPVQSRTLNGLDSHLSIVQMPGGVPVATTAIGKAGAIKAGLLAMQKLSMYERELEAQVAERRSMLANTVIDSSEQLG
ncbi:AIR carboxylase family protein, partial [Enterococcus faecium]|uniref:AIR carboxylase family protein n=1 Tax=Enterococcus faecium TaxID=1352 RepID=UPI000E03376B